VELLVRPRKPTFRQWSNAQLATGTDFGVEKY
jgi:hypothetical protein